MGTVAAIVLTANSAVRAQEPTAEAERILALERQLTTAQRQMTALQEVMQSIARELGALKQGKTGPASAADAASPVGAAPLGQPSVAPADSPQEEGSYAGRILVTDLGHDQRDHTLEPRPELFIQSRYGAIPIEGATNGDVTANLSLSRMELRWAGRVSDKFGMGYEIQFHPAPDGAAEELVNDAYLEYYAHEDITFRVGQFVKPFGFDIQHSSSIRESPERGIFAGYFFPGQRDRGVMMAAKLDKAGLRGTTFYAGAFNGNRFFNDNNRQVNYSLRLRKVLDSVPVAVGASVQLGNQLLPPGVGGDNNENVYGVDVQFVIGRLGVRGEYMVGNMPATLLGLEPEFAPGFVPGSHSSAGAAFFNLNLTRADDIYWRYDQFNNDPVTRRNVRAFNFGYLHQVGPNSRIGIDYQWKNRITFNDDELNTRLAVTLNLLY
jgi:hypothetical protein